MAPRLAHVWVAGFETSLSDDLSQVCSRHGGGILLLNQTDPRDHTGAGGWFGKAAEDGAEGAEEGAKEGEAVLEGDGDEWQKFEGDGDGLVCTRIPRGGGGGGGGSLRTSPVGLIRPSQVMGGGLGLSTATSAFPDMDNQYPEVNDGS